MANREWRKSESPILIKERTFNIYSKDFNMLSWNYPQPPKTNVQISVVFIANRTLEEVRMKVQPITDPKNIKRIKKLLADKPRDLLLFTMGINAGLRVQDLLALRIETVENAAVGDRITIREKKTGKQNVLIVNQAIKDALDNYLSYHKDRVPHEYLFKSRKYYNEPLTTYAVTHYVQKWCDEINLKGNYGARSLRKTWAYQSRKLGVPREILAKRLNHSNPAVTRRYMGVQDEEVEEALLNCI